MLSVKTTITDYVLLTDLTVFICTRVSGFPFISLEIV